MKYKFLLSLFSCLPVLCLANDSAQIINKTEGTPTLQTPIKEGQNLAYAAAFQLAWNEIIRNITKEPVKLTGNPKLAQQLNTEAYKEQAEEDPYMLKTEKTLSLKEPPISPESYIAEAGLKKNKIYEKIVQKMKSKFGIKEKDLNLPKNADMIAYAYLSKNIKFQQEFAPVKDFYFNDKKVKAFGINNSLEALRLGEQVSILYYQYNEKLSSNEYIVSIQGENEEDEIILALIPRPETLKQGADLVQELIDREYFYYFKTQDILKIPEIDFTKLTEFKELENKNFLNNAPALQKRPLTITHASQKIDFKLDAKGAVLKDEAKVVAIFTGLPEEKPIPKILVFNRPFLIILKQKYAKEPYFAVWVENTDIMNPTE